jgi:hypothetical protein
MNDDVMLLASAPEVFDARRTGSCVKDWQNSKKSETKSIWLTQSAQLFLKMRP